MRVKGAAAAAPRPSLERQGQPQGSVPTTSLSAPSAGVQRPGRGAGHLRAAPGRFVCLLRAEALPPGSLPPSPLPPPPLAAAGPRLAEGCQPGQGAGSGEQREGWPVLSCWR